MKRLFLLCALLAGLVLSSTFLAACGSGSGPDPLPPLSLKSVTDLAYLATIKGGSLPGLYATIFGTDPTGWAAASPITGVLLLADLPPMVLAYSGGSTPDQALSRRLATERFAAALDQAGIVWSVVPAPEKTHAEVNQGLGATGDHVTAAIMAFLGSL